MKMYVLQTMSPESNFWIAPNWLKFWKMIMTLRFVDIASLSNFSDDFLFLL